MAHVLARSQKLEISEDKSRVRPRATPHASPVRMAQPDSTGALLVSVIGSILSDANLCFDALLQACPPPTHTHSLLLPSCRPIPGVDATPSSPPRPFAGFDH